MSSLTNFEKIKGMSVEEMAEFLNENSGRCECCVYRDRSCIGECKMHIKEWLELEV